MGEAEPPRSACDSKARRQDRQGVGKEANEGRRAPSPKPQVLFVTALGKEVERLADSLFGMDPEAILVLAAFMQQKVRGKPASSRTEGELIDEWTTMTGRAWGLARKAAR